MSVKESRASSDPAGVQAASRAAVAAVDRSRETSGGSGGQVRFDTIVLSERARALVRAGRAMRALVMTALATAHRTLALASGLALVLDGGIYRTT